MKKRKVFPGEVHHVYQKTIKKVLVFYSASDFLVFFTIFCTIAKRYKVKVIALCPMVDHLHHVSVVNNQRQLSDFVKVYTQEFAKEWNKSRGRKGSLFHPRFGSAAKIGGKKVRTAIAYNNNNPVERQLVVKAEHYRWNFLSYALSRSPWSAPIENGDVSKGLKQAMDRVKLVHDNGKYLNYTILKRWTECLSNPELQQLADYVVSLWNVIDYNEAANYYGSFETMIRAFHDNTGAEWEIREETDNYSDAVYADCTKILLSEGYVKSVNEIPSMPEMRKAEIMAMLRKRTTAKISQLHKYLHYFPDK